MKNREMPPIIAITESSSNDNPGKSSKSCLKIQQKAVKEKTITTFFSSLRVDKDDKIESLKLR